MENGRPVKARINFRFAGASSEATSRLASATKLDRHSGMVRQHQTRNLEIPDSMPAHRSGMTKPSAPHVPQHKAGAAGTANTVAEVVRPLPRVGPDAHLIECPHATVTVLRAQQGRRLVADRTL